MPTPAAQPWPPALYLLPNALGTGPEAFAMLLPQVHQAVLGISHLLVENPRGARSWIAGCLRALGHQGSMDAEFARIQMHRLPEAKGKRPNTDEQQWMALFAPLFASQAMGLLSDAGLPAVADAGADAVAAAHRLGLPVVPLPGNSSLLLALAASGLGGQQFRFHGYLPRQQGPRRKALQQLERAAQQNETQLFIEAPYRNAQLLAAIRSACRPDTRLCIALDLTLPTQAVHTYPVGQWDAATLQVDKRPAVFLLGGPDG